MRMHDMRYPQPLVLLLLFVVTFVLAAAFIDWPLNRDITTYATIARELLMGRQLYVDVWDIKPPAIFATYMLVQWFIPDKPLQIFVLELVPTLLVLTALVYSAEAAGFRRSAGVWSGLIWVALSGDILFQNHEPNTEIFINACASFAFLQLLRLQTKPGTVRAAAIGVLFALACLYKTVAIVIAAGLGLAHLLVTDSRLTFPVRLRQLSLMVAAGALSLGAVVAYFAATDRLEVFRETIVDAGSGYAGDLLDNVIRGLTFTPIVGDNVLLNVVLAVGPWLLIATLAVLDRQRRRPWILLGVYAFSALIAVALPGAFYAHYFQLLVPPLCLGLGWLVGSAGPVASPRARTALLALAVVLFAGLCLYESRYYRSTPAGAVMTVHQELYLQTRALGRRLDRALAPDEVLYQWGEESGLYWYSNRRPQAAVLTFPLLAGPQADRLTGQTLQSLQSRPPDLIVAVNYMLDNGSGHPVFEWIQSNYVPVQPGIPGERKFFTFYVPATVSGAFVRRILGSGTSEPGGTVPMRPAGSS